MNDLHRDFRRDETEYIDKSYLKYLRPKQHLIYERPDWLLSGECAKKRSLESFRKLREKQNKNLNSWER